MLPYKTYNADLRGKYNKYIKVSLVITLLLVIAAFRFSPKASAVEKVIAITEEPILVKPEINTAQINEPPPMPKPLVPVISTDEVTEDIIMVDVGIDKKPDLTKPPVRQKEKTIEGKDIPFIFVEQMPEIIGGMKSLQSKLYYPEIVRRARIEGKVIVECIIDKKGNVESAQVIKSVIETLDEIALKAVKELKFSPGRQRDKPVRVRMTIPIDFRLK